MKNRHNRFQPYPDWQGERRAFRTKLDGQVEVYLKERADAPAGFFASERRGLEALTDAGARVPEVLSQGDDHIALKWIEAGPIAANGMADLGHQLAQVHSHKGPGFGYDCTTWCGEGRQDNRLMDNGHDFFAQRRLLPLGDQAALLGLLNGPEVQSLERLCAHLTDWLPEQPPVLIHGDLWSGNALVSREGQGVLIDPAVSWGWAEADLAMTHLFGGFDPAFYSAYRSLHLLAPGFDERRDLYNLYHLLNHLVIFGAAYHASVIRVLNRYG